MSASSGGREIFRDKWASSKELARLRGLFEETVLEDEEQEPCPAQGGQDGRNVEGNVSFNDLTPPVASSFSPSKTEDKTIQRPVYREKSDRFRELVHFRGLIKGAARYSLSKSQAKSIQRTEREKSARFRELVFFRGLLRSEAVNEEKESQSSQSSGAEKDVGRNVEGNVSVKDLTPPEASSFSPSKIEDKKIRRPVYREKSDRFRELVHFRGQIKGASRYSLSNSQVKSIRRTEREKSARFRELVLFRGLLKSEAVNEEKEFQPSQSSGAEKDVGRNVEGNVSFKDMTPPEASSFSPSKTEDKKIRRPVYREKSDRFRELVHFRGLIKGASRYSLSKSQVKSIGRTEREKAARFRELVLFRGLLRSEAVNEEKGSKPSQSSGAENVKHVGECVSVRRKNIVSFNQLGQLRGLTVMATEKKKEVRSNPSAVASFDLHETISTNTSVDGESRTANNSSDLKSSEDVKDKEEKEYEKQTTVEPKGGNGVETLEPSKTEANEEQKSRIKPKPEKELEKERKGTVQDKLKFVRETTYEQENTGTATESKGSVSQRRGQNIYIKPSKLTAVLDQARISKCITYIDDRSLTKSVDNSSQRKHNENEPSICDVKLVSSSEEHTQAQSNQFSIPIKEEKEMYLVQLKPEEESEKERKRIFQERLKFARETTQQDNVCIKPKELEVFPHEDEIQADQETEDNDSQRKVSKCVIKPSKLTEKLEQRGRAKVLTNVDDNVSVSDTTEVCTQRNQSGLECVQKQSIQVSIPIKDVKESNEKYQTNEEIQSADANIRVLRDNKDVPVTVTVKFIENTQERATNVSSKDRTPEMETVSTEFVQEKLAVRPSTNVAYGAEENIKKNSRIARDSSKENRKSVKNCQKYQTQEQICATDLRSQRRTVKKEKEKLRANVTFSDYESEQNKIRKTSKSSKEATFSQRTSNRYVETLKEEDSIKRKTQNTRAKGGRIMDLKITRISSNKTVVDINNNKQKNTPKKKNSRFYSGHKTNNSQESQRNARQACKKFQGREGMHTKSMNSRKVKLEEGMLIVNVTFLEDERSHDRRTLPTEETIYDDRTSNIKWEQVGSIKPLTERFLTKGEGVKDFKITRVFSNENNLKDATRRVFKNKKGMIQEQVTYSGDKYEKNQVDKTDMLAKERSQDQKTISKKGKNKDTVKTQSENYLPQEAINKSAVGVIKNSSVTENTSGVFHRENAEREVKTDKTLDPEIAEKHIFETDLKVSGEDSEECVCNKRCMEQTECSLPNKTKYAEGKEFTGDKETGIKEIYSAAKDIMNEDSNKPSHGGRIKDRTSSSQESGTDVETNKTKAKFLHMSEIELESSIESLADELSTTLATDQTIPKFSMEYNPLESIFKSQSSGYVSHGSQANIRPQKEYKSQENRTEERELKHTTNRPHVINQAVPKHKPHIQKPSNGMETKGENKEENIGEWCELQKVTLSIDRSSVKLLQSNLREAFKSGNTTNFTTEQTAKSSKEGHTTQQEIKTDDSTSNLQEQWTSASESHVANTTDGIQQIPKALNQDIPNPDCQHAQRSFKSMEAFTSKGRSAEDRKIKTLTQRTHRIIASGPACKAKQKRIFKNNTSRGNEGNITERELYYLQTNTLNIDSSSIEQLQIILAKAFRTSNASDSTGNNTSHTQAEQNKGRKKKNNTRKSKSKKKESVDVGCQTIEQEAVDLQTASKAPAAQNKDKIKKENGSKTKPRENCKDETEKNDVQETGITTETIQRSQRYSEQLPANDTQVTGIPSEARQTDQLSADDTQVTGISTETRQTDQLFADNTQLTGIFTEETQADQFSTDGTQVASISTEERQTDQLSTDIIQLTGISTEARQTDKLSTDNTQLTGISTEETQAGQFSTDGTQLTGISTGERQTDLLCTDNTQLTGISTEARQTDQRFTDTTQLTGISTEARQTDELSIDDIQLTGISTEETQANQFSTDGTQLTGISTEERQTVLLSTDNTQLTGISTETRQTDQLPTDDTQVTGTSTEARQTDQLPTDGTQLTGISTQARQTDQLPTDDTQVTRVSTEEIQTDQLSTDTTQVTSMFTEARQSDQLPMESQEINTNNDPTNSEDAKDIHGLYSCTMVHPENKDSPDAHSEGKTRSCMTKTAADLLKNFTDRINMDCTSESTTSNNQANHQMANRMQTDQFSIDNTQVTSISTEEVKMDQISTDNMQVTSISTEAKQTDQRSMESQEMEINTNIELANSEYGKEEHGLNSCAMVHPEDKVTLEPHSEDGIDMDCTWENSASYNQASQHQMKTNLIYNETLVRRRSALDPSARVDPRISTKNKRGCVDYAARKFDKDHMRSSQRKHREIALKRELQWPYYSRYTHRPMYRYPGDRYGYFGYPTYPLQPVQRQTKYNTCRYAPYYFSRSERKMQSERPEYSKNWTVPKPGLEEFLWCAGIVSAIFLTTWIML